jgi:hypothetical protein
LANLAIAWINLADSGALSATDTTALAPVTLLQNKHVHQKWRANASSSTITCTLESSTSSVDTIALMGLFGSGLTIRVKLFDAALALVYDSGSIANAWDPNYLPFVHLLSAPIVCGTVTIFISGSEDFVEAGRLFIGVRSQFAINFQPGWSRGWMDGSVKTIGRSGQAFDDLRDMCRTVTLTLEHMSETERWTVIEALDIAIGTHGDFLLMTNPDSSSTTLGRDSVWGFLQDIDPVVEPVPLPDGQRRYRRSISIRERL